MTRRLPATIALLAAGCAGRDNQSALRPAGVQADHIHGLYELYLAVAVGVFVLVMAFVLAGTFRRRRTLSDRPVTVPPVSAELRMAKVVAAAVLATVAILFVLLLSDTVTGRRIDSLGETDALAIRLTGHQWWWEVRYEAPVASDRVTTANEIHIPTGRTVRIELVSPDVIHSFWVPNLHGKTDLIPGHVTRTYLRTDREGVYWGQCAEFCGLQHANMRFQIVAQKEEDFRAWYAGQLKPPPEPDTPTRWKGWNTFRLHCAQCHSVSGTSAQGRVGPDLTHVAGRRWIAAGTREMTRGNLAGWVADPHGIKPGVRMPPNPLPPDELHALLDYLETLK